MRKIYVLGLSPSPNLLTKEALEVLQKAPVVFTYANDFPFNLDELLKGKKVVKLTPAFTDSSNRDEIIQRNIDLINSCKEEWGVFLEIGDSAVRNPLFYHILGNKKIVEIELIPGVSSVTAVLARLGLNVRHFCVVGSEEFDLIQKLVNICDTFVILNIQPKNTKVFEFLKSNGYDITFVKNCCNPDEEISKEYKGDTYWIIAVAILRKEKL
ncbi:cobalt-factor II C(20)-methyltransferase [Sulfurisphaera javensis]|uniref:Cobalt-factor II C(20)-methyltransferase n=1 Tax=Sulfurisphaera javensis TaxID=2049879 RepID=A0AAT9GUI0_9CREN